MIKLRFGILLALGLALVACGELDERTVEKDGQTITTESHHYLPAGTVIVKTYGSGWQCVDMDGSLILLWLYGNKSSAISVAECPWTEER